MTRIFYRHLERHQKCDRKKLLSCTAILMTAALAMFIAGCNPSGSTPTGAAKEVASDAASVMSDSVSYRHDRSMDYTLYDLSHEPPLAIGGGIVDRLASGGAKGCCIALPAVWKPGMKVRVRWDESDREKVYPEIHTRDLEIPRYDKPGDLYVVFYPEHEVEVVVSVGEPGHPDWQGKIKQTPWDACVQAYGRKPCKAALPKQFDTSARGFCVYLKEEWPDDKEKQGYCESSMIDCMRDYEDENFCKSILWGEPCTSANKEISPYCIAREKRLQEKN